MISQYCLFYLAAKNACNESDFYDWFQMKIEGFRANVDMTKEFDIEPVFADTFGIVL